MYIYARLYPSCVATIPHKRITKRGHVVCRAAFFLFSAMWTAKLVWNTDYWENTAEKVSSSFFPWCFFFFFPLMSHLPLTSSVWQFGFIRGTQSRTALCHCVFLLSKELGVEANTVSRALWPYLRLAECQWRAKLTGLLLKTLYNSEELSFFMK